MNKDYINSYNKIFKNYDDNYSSNYSSHISNYKNIRDNNELKDNHPYNIILKDIQSILNIEDSTYIENDNLVKKISIEYYPFIYPTNYFNGSIIKYKNELLLFYRTDNKKQTTNNWFMESSIHAVQLNQYFEPISENKLIKLNHNTKNWNIKNVIYQNGNIDIPQHLFLEDPRVILWNDNIILTYTDGYKVYTAILDENLEVIDEYDYFNRDNNYTLATLKIDKDQREKNWSSFIYDDKLHYIYGLNNNEHIVLEMHRDNIWDIHRTYCPLESDHKYKYGGIRGGTPALPFNCGEFENCLITFTHSVKKYEIEWTVYIYTMGYYIFKNEPPFEVVGVGSTPLLKPDAFPTLIDRASQQNLVIFPSGVIRNDSNTGYIISFGYHDTYTKLIEVQDTILIHNLSENII